MIQLFAAKRTQALFLTGTAKRLSQDVAPRAARKLEYVDLATTVDDLKVPPGNRLHALVGDHKRLHAIAVNDVWRTCFQFVVCDVHQSAGAKHGPVPSIVSSRPMRTG